MLMELIIFAVILVMLQTVTGVMLMISGLLLGTSKTFIKWYTNKINEITEELIK